MPIDGSIHVPSVEFYSGGMSIQAIAH